MFNFFKKKLEFKCDNENFDSNLEKVSSKANECLDNKKSFEIEVVFDGEYYHFIYFTFNESENNTNYYSISSSGDMGIATSNINDTQAMLDNWLRTMNSFSDDSGESTIKIKQK